MTVDTTDPGQKIVVDGGDGDDEIDASLMTKDKTQPFLFGGPGKDVIVGSPGQDVITGGILRFLPTAGLVAGMRDLFDQSIISGSARLGEAFLLASAIVMPWPLWPIFVAWLTKGKIVSTSCATAAPPWTLAALRRRQPLP